MIREIPVKYFTELVQTIGHFDKSGWGKLMSDPVNGIKARLKKDNNQYLINWTDPGRVITPSITNREYWDLDYYFKKYQLRLENVHVGSFMLGHGHVRTTTEVDFFHTIGYQKDLDNYYRLIIPLEYNLDFFFQLTRKAFLDDFGIHNSNGTIINIEDDILQVCLFKDEVGKMYLSIESNKKQAYAQFSDKAMAVVNALAYFTGYLAGGHGWYFAYDDESLSHYKHFYRVQLRNSIRSFYTPINTNAAAWVRGRADIDKWRGNILKPVPVEILSNFCLELYQSLEFTTIILLILEASVASLTFMPGGYAIALESLADYMSNNEKEALAPMDKGLSKIVRDRLSNVINEECSAISEENRNILLGKINQINQITNKSRLRRPFERLGIPLTESDQKLIETRNDFLHGRIPDLTNAGPDRPVERMNKDLYYSSVRFYTLLSRLILSWIGYDNYVLNHAKIQEKFTRIITNEDYYLKTCPRQFNVD